MGSIVTVTLINLINTLFLKYIIDVVGFSAALAATIVGGTRIFDALIDPLMGSISDRTRTRWGRRRPYLLLGGLLCAVAPIALFSVPDSLSQTGMIIYVTGGLLFYTIAATCFNVPYLSMPVEMTASKHERTRLISYRIYGFAAGGLLGGSLGPWLVNTWGAGRSGYEQMAMVVGCGIFAFAIASFFMTARARFAPVEKTRGRLPQLRQLRQAAKNTPLIVLFSGKVLIGLNAAISATGLAFLITTILGQSLSVLGLYVGFISAGLVISQTFWLRGAKHYGLKVVCVFAIVVYAIVQSSWWIATAAEPVWIGAIRAFLTGIFAGGSVMCTQAMLPNVLQYEVDRTGERYEGLLTGFFSTIERAMSAIGVIIGGAILSHGGYISGGSFAEQPASAVHAVYLCVAIVPVVLLLLSAVVLTRFKIPDIEPTVAHAH